MTKTTMSTTLEKLKGLTSIPLVIANLDKGRSICRMETKLLVSWYIVFPSINGREIPVALIEKRRKRGTNIPSIEESILKCYKSRIEPANK